MLTLVTGVPGSGKTLNTIKDVLEYIQSDPANAFRPVFYHNIPELKVPSWVQIDDEQANRWYELPSGSIVVFDEGQAIYPQRDYRQPVPDRVSSLNTHRHGGYDLWIITQHPKLIDAAVRRLVGKHIHFDRRFGSTRVNRFTWQKCVDDPNDYHTKREAVKDAIVLDKKIYGLYKSAEIHTHKRKFPKKVIAAFAFFLVAPVLFYLGISNLALTANNPGTTTASIPIPGQSNTTSQAFTPVDVSSYTPRVPGFPHTAPIYDQLNKPIVMPKYNCLYLSEKPNTCRCYTQQATRMDVPISICLDIAKNGLFDPTKPDEPSGEGARAPTGTFAGAPPPTPHIPILIRSSTGL